jgi:hypothetical protein
MVQSEAVCIIQNVFLLWGFVFLEASNGIDDIRKIKETRKITESK